ncbi:MAG: enoyl-[acyl-carrier-protein] reductase FabL [Myxococcales bacterium]|nr:enoyl-[acyl-carrier-protein] reductase FabL [Myxococcales bacterium]
MSENELSLQGKRVLITGGSGDIGRALCVAFARRGARVAFTYFSSHDGRARTEEAIAAVSDQEPVAIRGNLRDKSGPDEIADAALEAFGAIDVFISNAATGVLRPALELTAKHWDWTMNVNARSMLLLTNRLAPTMPEGGRIMAISSVGAVRALDHYAAIGASKAALESTARHLAMELGPRGITVNVLCPGVVDTQALDHFPMREKMLEVARFRTPNGRIATPADVADVAILLASPMAAMIQGQTITIDGGYGVLA